MWGARCRRSCTCRGAGTGGAVMGSLLWREGGREVARAAVPASQQARTGSEQLYVGPARTHACDVRLPAAAEPCTVTCSMAWPRGQASLPLLSAMRSLHSCIHPSLSPGTRRVDSTQCIHASIAPDGCCSVAHPTHGWKHLSLERGMRSQRWVATWPSVCTHACPASTTRCNPYAVVM